MRYLIILLLLLPTLANAQQSRTVLNVQSNGCPTAACYLNPQTTLSGNSICTSGSICSGYQSLLSLLPGTYTNGNWCSYTSSGTLLNCNNAVPQVNLSLIAGTYTNANVCTYASSGTFLNCNTPASTWLTPTGSAASLTSFPTLNQNTSGTAANLSGTPALPNGTTATTQSQSDGSTKLATTAYVDIGLATKITSYSRISTGSIASGAATTILATTAYHSWLITAWVADSGANYQTTATVINDGTVIQLLNYVHGASITLTISSSNIQVTQSSGMSVSVLYSVVQIG